MRKQTLDNVAIGTMVLLCITWGFQQIAVKWSAPDMSPTLQIGLRSGVGVLLVFAITFYQRQSLNLFGDCLKSGILVGCMFAVEFLLVGEGLRLSNASHVVIFLYTAPIFVALGMHFTDAQERLLPLQWLGVLLAFLGIVIAFSGGFSGQDLNTDMLLGDALSLLAGAAWALTTITVRASKLAYAPAKQTLQYQLIGAFLVLPIAAFFLGQGEINHTTFTWTNVILQGLILTVSYLAWFWLLTKYSASKLSVLSFLTPLFGVLFGVVFLGEQIESNFIIGAILVTSGIMLVNLASFIKK